MKSLEALVFLLIGFTLANCNIYAATAVVETQYIHVKQCGTKEWGGSIENLCTKAGTTCVEKIVETDTLKIGLIDEPTTGGMFLHGRVDAIELENTITGEKRNAVLDGYTLSNGSYIVRIVSAPSRPDLEGLTFPLEDCTFNGNGEYTVLVP